MKKIITTVLLSLLVFTATYSQEQDVSKELKRVLQTYNGIPSLSFDINYYYADERQPAVYLDSLKGHINMMGSRYWYSVDSTETISNNDYVIVLYKSDRVMYLTRPSAASAQLSPVAMLDSFLAKKNLYTGRVIYARNYRKVVIDFRENLPYKKIEYLLDNKTGLISQITSTVRSDQMYHPSVQGRGESENSYVIVEMRFNYYQEKTLEEKLFDTSRYFKKDSNQYIALPPYDNYKIFIGTPNL